MEDNKQYQVLDAGSMIAEYDIYNNNVTAYIDNKADFEKYVGTVEAGAQLTAENDTIPQLKQDLANVGITDDSLLQIAENFGITVAEIFVSQRLHNIYPVYDIDILASFRCGIFSRIVEEMRIQSATQEELIYARCKFLDDELRKCTNIRQHIYEAYKSPSKRSQQIKLLLVIDKYLQYISNAVTSLKKCDIEFSDAQRQKLSQIFEMLKPHNVFEGDFEKFIQCLMNCELPPMPIGSQKKTLRKWLIYAISLILEEQWYTATATAAGIDKDDCSGANVSNKKLQLAILKIIKEETKIN